MPPNIFTPPAIRSSRVMIRRKVGAGATSTRYGSISPTAPRRSLARFQDTFEVSLDGAPRRPVSLEGGGSSSQVANDLHITTVGGPPSGSAKAANGTRHEQ